MPPPRKVDLLPEKFRTWLKHELVARGFGDYEALADDLNLMLEEEGLELRIQKSALHSFGQEHEQFVKLSEEASAWTQSWLSQEGLESEAEGHKVLFQMIQTLCFKVMKGMLDEDREVDPKDLHFLGKMLKDVMSSAGIREKIMADERERIAAEEREKMAGEVEAIAKSSGLDGDLAAELRNKLLGIKS